MSRKDRNLQFVTDEPNFIRRMKAGLSQSHDHPRHTLEGTALEEPVDPDESPQVVIQEKDKDRINEQEAEAFIREQHGIKPNQNANQAIEKEDLSLEQHGIKPNKNANQAIKNEDVSLIGPQFLMNRDNANLGPKQTKKQIERNNQLKRLREGSEIIPMKDVLSKKKPGKLEKSHRSEKLKSKKLKLSFADEE